MAGRHNSYPGVTDPAGLFAEMQPIYDKLQKAQDRCRPMGRNYHMIEALLNTMSGAATHFTGNRIFFDDGRHFDFSNIQRGPGQG